MFSFSTSFLLRTHTTYCKYEATSCLIYISTRNEARRKEGTDRGRSLPLRQKRLFIPGSYKMPLFNYSVCAFVCYIRRFHWLRELYEADFHKPGIYGSGRVWANAWDVFRRTPSRGGRGRRAAVNFVVCFGCGGISFFSFFFFERTRPAASMRPLCLIYVSTSNYVNLSRNVVMPLWFKFYY